MCVWREGSCMTLNHCVSLFIYCVSLFIYASKEASMCACDSARGAAMCLEDR